MLLFQGSFVLWTAIADPTSLVRLLGFAGGPSGTVAAWVLAAAVAAVYVWGAASISVVRQHMFKANRLKLLTIAAAVVAGILEEVVFRKWVMDFLQSRGYAPAVQVLASGLSFGLAHFVWGFKRVSAGINAALSTGALGLGLGIVYLVGGRSLAPCVVAHFVITALIEPGLILAAVTDKLSYLRERV